MHDCRKVKDQLSDLLFNEMNVEQQRRLIAEIETCPVCEAEYSSLAETLFIFDQTAQATQPDETYWMNYEATLRQRLAQADERRTDRVPFWKRALTASVRVPVPVAAALVIMLLGSSWLAGRDWHRSSNVATPSTEIAERIRTVEVPVVQEKIVTRTVYIEKKRRREIEVREQSPSAGSGATSNLTARALRQPAGSLPRASLFGFQPAGEVKLRIIKANIDEK